MNREQKAVVIESLKDDFSKSQASFVIEYKGLTVKQLQSLRKELGSHKGTFRVAKARLIKCAVDGMSGVSDLSPYFKEQVGVVFVNNEAPQVAKVLQDFSKKNEALKLIAGYFDAQIVSSDTIGRIASLPSREVLLGQICGTLQAPITKLAIVLNMQMVRLVVVLKQIQEKNSSLNV
jgi:large subunit ribosomal protein L10